MRKRLPHHYLGLAGVPADASFPVLWTGRFFLALMSVVALALLSDWSTHWVDQLPTYVRFGYRALLWLSFALEVAVLTALVADKRQYLRTNWLKCAIVWSGVPLLFFYHHPWIYHIYQHISPFLALLILLPWCTFAERSLSDNRLLTTLITFFAVIIVAGFLMAGLDPAVHTPLEGFWWVLVTMSTVGYGDVVPTSGVGRLFASLLILAGLGFFAVVTANFASLFLRRNVQTIERESREILHVLEQLPRLKDKEDELAQTLRKLDKRLKNLEKRALE